MKIGDIFSSEFDQNRENVCQRFQISW